MHLVKFSHNNLKTPTLKTAFDISLYTLFTHHYYGSNYRRSYQKGFLVDSIAAGKHQAIRSTSLGFLEHELEFNVTDIVGAPSPCVGSLIEGLHIVTDIVDAASPCVRSLIEGLHIVTDIVGTASPCVRSLIEGLQNPGSSAMLISTIGDKQEQGYLSDVVAHSKNTSSIYGGTQQ